MRSRRAQAALIQCYIRFPISTSVSQASSSHAPIPLNFRPTQMPCTVINTAPMKNPSNHRSTQAGSKTPAPNASLITLPTSFGIIPRSMSAELITYIPLTWLSRRAKFDLVARRTEGMKRAKRWNVCMTAENEARSMMPERKKEICRAQDAWSREG